MVPRFLFLTVLGVLFTTVACDKDGYVHFSLAKEGALDLNDDELCRSAGYVPKAEITTTAPAQDDDTSYDGMADSNTKMSANNITLVVFGVVAGVIVIAFMGNYYYKKQKDQ